MQKRPDVPHGVETRQCCQSNQSVNSQLSIVSFSTHLVIALGLRLAHALQSKHYGTSPGREGVRLLQKEAGRKAKAPRSDE